MNNDKKYNIELDQDELMVLAAIALMHYTGFMIEIHPNNRPALERAAQKLSALNIKNLAGL